MAKRAKKQILEAEWTEGKEEMIKDYLSKSVAYKKDFSIDMDGLNKFMSSISPIDDTDVRWVSDMQMKYGSNIPIEMIRKAMPKHVVTKAKYNFESKLADEQIFVLLPVMNKFVFKDAQSLNSVKLWLACENMKPIQVKNNGFVAYMMSLLYESGWICQNWELVASVQNTFSSNRGKCLDRGDLSKALTIIRTGNYKSKKKKAEIENVKLTISNVIKGLKK